MALTISENIIRSWDIWNLRVLIILSCVVQFFLALMALMRRGKYGKRWFVRWLIWFSYLSAHSIATYTIGLIFESNRSASATPGGPPSDIRVFWAPFLLLHLGGPDSITSYSLEDNNLWLRHLAELILQVISTVYLIFKYSKNMLLGPTILVLFTGILKYGERTVALYRASFNHFGSNWVLPNGNDTLGFPIPKELANKTFASQTLQNAAPLFGILKRILVGPRINEGERNQIRERTLAISGEAEVLRVLEAELGLLYEALHTKLPVIRSKEGKISRFLYWLCCIAALVWFIISWLKNPGQWPKVDVGLAIGLLVASLLLDSISLAILVRHSDYFCNLCYRYQWSHLVSQSNIICFVKDYHSSFLKKLVCFPYVNTLLRDKVLEFGRKSSKNFENQSWRLIYDEVKQFRGGYQQRISEVWLPQPTNGVTLFNDNELPFFEDLNYTKSFLVLHIASELCFQDDVQSMQNQEQNLPDLEQDRHNGEQNSAAAGQGNYKTLCKLLSDYMFHLAATQSNLLSPVLDDWEGELEKILEGVDRLVGEENCTTEAVICNRLRVHEVDNAETVLERAIHLAREFGRRNYPWNETSKVWVQFMCHAAINGEPYVHAQQPCQGGELLTLVWLLMIQLGEGVNYHRSLRNLTPPTDE